MAEITVAVSSAPTWMWSSVSVPLLWTESPKELLSMAMAQYRPVFTAGGSSEAEIATPGDRDVRDNVSPDGHWSLLTHHGARVAAQHGDGHAHPAGHGHGQPHHQAAPARPALELQTKVK